MAFDVVTPQILGRGEIAVSPALTTFYTTPANTRTMVKTIDVANTSATSATVTVHLVPSGDVAGPENMLIPGVSLAGGGMFQWAGVQVLSAGDTIQATSDIAGVVYHGSGGEAQ